ncbi:hypothetical protein ATO7_07742 [Oceanococcus atlanticus]|uniref:Uncharacterized protein n=1 Tax=Oceanococcus atlanticus TaxID=1317117 RepID=A0A1Y1SDZ3_9GAMM|nr:hypothetical protein [Oceanococcus atlanticus]ORE86914.1 hypothetical protein ATO7_07742 [Oceanococcus atlanticus]
MSGLSESEWRQLRRIQRGLPLSGEPGESATLLNLRERGLIESLPAQMLPLENTARRWRLTEAGRDALK